MDTPELDSLTPEEVRPLVDFFLRDDPEHTEGTLQAITEIIGAAINLKPATMRHLTLTDDQLQAFQNILANLHLCHIIEELPLKELPPDEKFYDFFISRNLDTAKELQKTLHASLALGWCPENPDDQKLDERGIINHRPDADRDRYYIHSPEHFRAEYEQFEDILHPAVSKFAPTVANEMHQKTHYLWTSADL